VSAQQPLVKSELGHTGVHAPCKQTPQFHLAEGRADDTDHVPDRKPPLEAGTRDLLAVPASAAAAAPTDTLPRTEPTVDDLAHTWLLRADVVPLAPVAFDVRRPFPAAVAVDSDMERRISAEESAPGAGPPRPVASAPTGSRALLGVRLPLAEMGA
jgi:hypothetical protein